MTERNIFLSYASGGFIPARDALCRSALGVGFDEARARGKEDIHPDFAEAHQAILSQPRGAGYWLWKPQIILQELRTLQAGDLLVYSDAGRSDYYLLQRFPTRLAQRARKNGFLLGPTIGQHGPMSKWTKRDAFVLLDMDRPEIHDLAPIQATWSLWTPSIEAFAFLEHWIAACSDPRILTDMENTQGIPNLQDFKDHRHDQAVLSLLAHKMDAPFLNYSGKLVERILQLRPQSSLAHHFLKRLSDSEAIEENSVINGLIQALKIIRTIRSN